MASEVIKQSGKYVTDAIREFLIDTADDVNKLATQVAKGTFTREECNGDLTVNKCCEVGSTATTKDGQKFILKPDNSWVPVIESGGGRSSSSADDGDSGSASEVQEFTFDVDLYDSANSIYKCKVTGDDETRLMSALENGGDVKINVKYEPYAGTGRYSTILVYEGSIKTPGSGGEYKCTKLIPEAPYDSRLMNLEGSILYIHKGMELDADNMPMYGLYVFYKPIKFYPQETFYVTLTSKTKNGTTTTTASASSSTILAAVKRGARVVLLSPGLKSVSDISGSADYAVELSSVQSNTAKFYFIQYISNTSATIYCWSIDGNSKATQTSSYVSNGSGSGGINL